MSKKFFLLFFIAGIFSCKTASVLADYGVEKGDEYASIAVLPDTQYYTALRHGGTMSMFQNQVDWLVKNYQKEKIAYVIHLGDITDHNAPVEWERAASAMYRLDATKVPYGLAVGNHDQTPNGTPSAGSDTTQYTRYFGKTHFGSRPWYGGALGNNNNSDTHFDLFTANGDKYLVMYFAFNQPDYKGYNEAYEKQMLNWADSVLTAQADRKAILVCHSMLGRPKGTTSGDKPGAGDNSLQSNFTKQGKGIYEMAKNHSNVFLMLGGHIAGEGYRKDTYNGNTIKTYLSDYQSRQGEPYEGAKDRNGGNGTMRLMRLNKTKQTLSIVTFIPQANGSVIKETDGDSQFTDALYK
ncbi:metallophosphoesterase [Niabella sp. CJ426]|uniref:metallophosphoesterase n=1 Tax=Niabella sp. CJ426 TaxID=3393740 RepID=UPI003CFF97CF